MRADHIYFQSSVSKPPRLIATSFTRTKNITSTRARKAKVCLRQVFDLLFASRSQNFCPRAPFPLLLLLLPSSCATSRSLPSRATETGPRVERARRRVRCTLGAVDWLVLHRKHRSPRRSCQGVGEIPRAVVQAVLTRSIREYRGGWRCESLLIKLGCRLCARKVGVSSTAGGGIEVRAECVPDSRCRRAVAW